MSLVVEDLREWQAIRAGSSLETVTLGFVPTMGNLHPGHISLLDRSVRENDCTILSIFVNPTQFDETKDLETYPRTLEEDLRKAQESGVDYVLLPRYQDLYPDNYRYKVTEHDLSRQFCGAFRKGHFDGVLSVVLKFLLIVRPGKAYFGEKDYQQFLLVRDMAKAFFLDCEIVSCPIVRDLDGLALSSRNENLLPSERELAIHFPRLLRRPGTAAETRQKLKAAGFIVDYVEDFEGRRLAAVRVGETRLIDNVPLPVRSPEPEVRSQETGVRRQA